MASDAPHRRTKSSVLSIASFMHRRTPSDGISLPSNDTFIASPVYEDMPVLSRDARALGELHNNHQSPPQSSWSPKKPKDEKRTFLGTTDDAPPKSLHKTLSYISLRSLAGDADKAPKTKEPKAHKPKKTKSITNLGALLSRTKNKENQSPAEPLLPAVAIRPPPIYAQFSSEYFTKQPLGGKFLEDEIDLYTPGGTSIRKQRDFFESYGQQPSLTKRDEGNSQRPHSTYLPSSFSVQDIARRVSNGSRHSAEIIRRVSGPKRPTFQRASTDRSARSEISQRSDKAEKLGPSRGKRVLAAVAAFSTKDPKPSESEPGFALTDHNVDKEFEAMLDRRNIPEHQRGKMRNLALSMKKDFVRQDWAEIAAAKNGVPRTENGDSSAEIAAEPDQVSAIKSKRPRSRTFTISLSRASSKESLPPTKKKTESTSGKSSRPKSMEIVTGGTRSMTSASLVAQNLIAKAKGQCPDDFVSYLRKVTKPELVEVGRLHKLRLLLRNETVVWTDDFIRLGGMAEIVSLLHRTMVVEWREEHEDALLHEVLLCLKALSTTALALKNLDGIQHTLFPALLHMIFDEEKKGPSEFTTRNIITWLLFTYLKSASISERTHRAKILLSYLKNSEPVEEQRPVGFVLEMWRPRPYTTWCKEVTNVTKEVFWIFLHTLNVIALPGAEGSLDLDERETSNSPLSPTMTNSSFDASNSQHQYMAKHFPQERPPVPAAPYVGGVEWDATNYLASHLDIINGILSCLPTREERNELREQLLVSGWEKCMGITLRTCKEKFYGGVHAGLRCWVAAAVDDGWDTKNVRNGPCMDKKSPIRKAVSKALPDQAPPKIDLKMEFLSSEQRQIVSDDVWL